MAADPEGASVVSYSDPPPDVRSLEQGIRNHEGGDGLALRRPIVMVLVVLGQMLPEEQSKAEARWPNATADRLSSPKTSMPPASKPLARFRSDFEESLTSGWACRQSER